MSRSIIQTSVPSTELVTSADMSPMLHGYPAGEEGFLTATIAAVRDLVERKTGYALAPRNFIQYADRFKMQSIYNTMFPVPLPLLGVPNSTTSNRRSPFEMILRRSPVLALSKIDYVDLGGNLVTLTPNTDFAVDLTSDPARVLPLSTPPGTSTFRSFWPAALPGPKAVAIHFTAGFYTTADQLTTEAQPRDLGCPPAYKALVMAITRDWFIDRDNYGYIRPAIEDLLFSLRATDYDPEIE